MNPTEQYQEIIQSNLVGETTFLEQKPYRIVHESLAERSYVKDGKVIRYSYTVLGVEPV